MSLPVRRKFLELVIHKLAIARALEYKLGWVWHEVRRELFEGNDFEGFYYSELAYLARRLGYRPRWAHFAYSSLPDECQLGADPSQGKKHSSDGRWDEAKDTRFYDDPLQAALSFFNLERHFTASQLKSVYRSLALRYHPDTGGSHETFLTLQAHYEILARHAQ